MLQCKLCGGTCTEASKKEAEQIVELIKTSKEFAHLQSYAHYYPYCPKCGTAFYNFSDEQIKILEQNKNSIKQIYADKTFLKADPNKFALNCECAGYTFELVGMHSEAAFAYAAAADILNLCLVKYLADNKKEILKTLGDPIDYTKLNDFEVYKNCMERIDILRRLALGHVIETKSNKTDHLFLYVSLVIDFNKAELALKTLDQVESMNYEWLNEPVIKNTIACLRNKAQALIDATTIAIDVDKQNKE